MRDIALTLVFSLLLVLVFRYPAIGVYLWAWLSMMNPHQLAYGFALEVPYAQIAAIVTLVMLLVSKQRKPFPLNAITVAQLVLLGWMTFTTLFALSTPELLLERWLFVLKIQVMLFATWMLLRGRRQIEVLIWVVTMSVAFYGIKGGIWTIVTGGGGRVWGPPGGLIQGNNELAVALVMLMPFLVYLFQVSRRWWVRLLLAASLGVTAFAVLGTQSRGALLAILAMAAFMTFKGRYKVRAGIALVALVALAIQFMPQEWTQRMETIRSYDAESSALSRLYTWQTLWNAAKDRPLVGVGFRADDINIFRRYAPTGEPWTQFEDAVWVAHSIYFQMLGEHGFPGLALFIWLFWTAWRRAGQLAVKTRGDPEFGAWVPLLMPMIQVSLVGYAVGGAFLSLAYFDLPYYIIAYVVLVDATLRERVAAPATDAAAGAQVRRATDDDKKRALA